jgi:hypothetical protein
MAGMDGGMVCLGDEGVLNGVERWEQAITEEKLHIRCYEHRVLELLRGSCCPPPLERKEHRSGNVDFGKQ